MKQLYVLTSALLLSIASATATHLETTICCDNELIAAPTIELTKNAKSINDFANCSVAIEITDITSNEVKLKVTKTTTEGTVEAPQVALVNEEAPEPVKAVVDNITVQACIVQ